MGAPGMQVIQNSLNPMLTFQTTRKPATCRFSCVQIRISNDLEPPTSGQTSTPEFRLSKNSGDFIALRRDPTTFNFARKALSPN